jgi:outer membrane autotransporter protein
MGTNGSVNDLTGGIITGGTNGVEIAGTGSVVNVGSIIGTNGSGVYIGAGGSVNNLSGGTNYGGLYGVYITGGAGYVTNAGTIISKGNGVNLQAGGSVSNQSGGFILGNTNGVYITGGAGTLINAGTIIGYTNDGVYMGTNGSVNNLIGGIITGGNNGVAITGDQGTVINAGTITGTNSDGVQLNVNVSGSVDNSGTISGGFNGVGMNGGGSVTINNAATGIITGGSSGLAIAGPASVTNAGIITGNTFDGVWLQAGGYVTNAAGGIITGGANGVEIDGTGSVVNAGTITGGINDGVYIDPPTGGGVTNLAGGNIYGNTNGVKITGAGTVVNYGTIIGTNKDGVYLGASGSVNNDGMIIGGTNGVEITNGAGSVVNAGSIETPGPSTGNDAIHMTGGGSVDNQLDAFIGGHNNGVSITGGAAFVTNAGTIIGISGTAISLDNYSNTVVLQTGSDVQGNIVGGTTPNDAAILQGHGSFYSNFVNFETLTVQGTPANWNDPADSWNLTGNNTFATNATVVSGLLRINGSLTTPLLTVDGVASPALQTPFLTNYAAILASDTNGLGGTGVITGIVDNHGYFSPGNSIGTLTIMGSMTNWGNYYAQVDPAGNSDHIVVSNTATINGGNVIVDTAPGIYAVHTTYTILTATNGVSGMYVTSSIVMPTWQSTNTLFPLTGSSLHYDPYNVYLTLNRTPFISVANTYNQRAVAGALDGVVVVGFSPTNTMYNLVNQFYGLGSAAAARAALDSMSGEIHGTLGMLNVQQQDAFNNSIALRTGRISAGGSGGYASTKPVQLASAGSTLPPMQSEANQPLDNINAYQIEPNIWLQGFGTFGHLDGDGNASGGDFTISGLSGGLDYHLCPEMLVGVAVGYSHDDASVGGPGASGTVDAIQFAGYGGYVNGPWHLDGIFSYGYLQTDTKRFINVGSIHQEADGSYNGNVFSLSTEGGYAFEAGPVTIEPTVGLNYTHLSQDSFQETGAGPNGLNVHSVDMDSVRTALGVRLAAQFGKNDGVQFIPTLRAGWEHEFADKTADVNASFIGGSGDFIVRGVELGADSGVLGVGLTVSFNKAIQGFVNYDANLNTRMSSHAVSGGLSYSW